MEYIDLADEQNQTEFADLLTLATEQGMPYPLVAINGEVRLAGSVEYHHVAPLVEELLFQESAA